MASTKLPNSDKKLALLSLANEIAENFPDKTIKLIAIRYFPIIKISP
jgi:hypothetical protein